MLCKYNVSKKDVMCTFFKNMWAFENGIDLIVEIFFESSKFIWNKSRVFFFWKIYWQKQQNNMKKFEEIKRTSGNVEYIPHMSFLKMC